MVSIDFISAVFVQLSLSDGPGLNVVIRRLYAERFGVEPNEQEFGEIIVAFEAAWVERYTPRRPVTDDCSPGPIGAGSPYYVREGELSPWQENAIRILEDG